MTFTSTSNTARYYSTCFTVRGPVHGTSPCVLTNKDWATGRFSPAKFWLDHDEGLGTLEVWALQRFGHLVDLGTPMVWTHLKFGHLEGYEHLEDLGTLSRMFHPSGREADEAGSGLVLANPYLTAESEISTAIEPSLDVFHPKNLTR